MFSRDLVVPTVYVRIYPHTATGAVKTAGRGGGGGDSANYRGPTALHVFLYFSVVYLSTVQINPFIPSPSHSATESQSFRLSVNFFSLFSLGPEPAVGGKGGND